jgi:hypothetical protein
MDSPGKSGFDMSTMSTADKLLAAGSILLLIDSFFAWQSFDVGGLGDIIGIDNSISMWQGSGAIFGVLAGLLTIALVIVGVLSMMGMMAGMSMGTMTPDKIVGFLGLGVFAFGILKFIFALTESPGWAAFVGLILLLAVGWGAWQKIQSTGGFTMGGTSGGGTMGGGTIGGGPMGGGTPPPSAPPPSTPPSGGMPPADGSSDY